MPTAPVEVALTVRPRTRIDLLDVRRRVSETHGDVLEPFPLALYSSFHTTAGYLDQSLATRLSRKRDGLGSYLSFFRNVFPEGAGYKHDQLDLREELSDAQRRTEPPNADSHLAFISAGLRNCVAYRGRAGEPVYFIDLDGVYRGRPRQRVTTVLGYSREEVAAPSPGRGRPAARRLAGRPRQRVAAREGRRHALNEAREQRVEEVQPQQPRQPSARQPRSASRPGRSPPALQGHHGGAQFGQMGRPDRDHPGCRRRIGPRRRRPV